MTAQALRSALAARAKEGKVLVVDGLSFEVPKTKEAIKAMAAWGVEGKALLVLVPDEGIVAYAFRNLPGVHPIAEDQLNTYDVLNAEWTVFSRQALDAFQARLAGRSGS
jgi:large subunit ribosomal protein L4